MDETPSRMQTGPMACSARAFVMIRIAFRTGRWRRADAGSLAVVIRWSI